MVQNRDQPHEIPAGAIDPYALAEALIGRKIDRLSVASASAASDLQDGYDDLTELNQDDTLSREPPRPDKPPKDVNVGAINPYALVEALVGRRIEWTSVASTRVLADVLQTDYDELFDLKYNSLLYAGLTLNERERRAERLSEKDIKILNERDLETPDFSQAHEAGDLQKLGLKDLLRAPVKRARVQNGKLHLVLEAHELARTVNNYEVTLSINELALPFRVQKGRWTPPNSSWREAFSRFPSYVGAELGRVGIENGLAIGRRQGSFDSRRASDIPRFDDPVQGAVGNSWLIAAIFSVFWADPAAINRNAHSVDEDPDREDEREGNRRRTLSVRFFDKGGENNSHTATVDVDYEIPINNSDNEPVYSRASDGYAIWPSLYEKAFAKWITQSESDHPDITQTYAGDPIKALAQISNREPQYYFTDRHSSRELAGLVRSFSVNYRTISPIAAYTHATGHRYRGSNLVANHAYSVLGWASNGRQHIIVRNPFGVTEPPGLTSYPGLLDRVEPEFWPPASFLDRGGVLAIEAEAFKEYFAVIGVAK